MRDEEGGLGLGRCLAGGHKFWFHKEKGMMCMGRSIPVIKWRFDGLGSEF